MADYEATAYLSLEKLREKHLVELQQLQERIKRDYKIKLKFTKDLMEKKKRVHVLTVLRRYDDAESIKRVAEVQEEEERSKMESQIAGILEK